MGAYKSEWILYTISSYISTKLGLLTFQCSAVTCLKVLWKLVHGFFGNFIQFLTVEEFLRLVNK